jgi:hypothetical protein
MPPLTVIGSCRVYEPLLKSGLTLAQQEVPAYTHNSKEVLQLLSLGTKGAQNTDVLEKITCIRRGLQGFTEIPAAERFFVVEISSIRVVSYHNWYLQISRFFVFCSTFSQSKLWHSIFFGEAELKAALRALPGLPLDVDDISYYEQEEEELMADLREIYRQLQGRVLFVSHFNCDEAGAPIWQRSLIRQCLARLQAETSVALFDPTPAMKEFGIAQAMQDQSHYTAPFEEKISQLLVSTLKEIVPEVCVLSAPQSVPKSISKSASEPALEPASKSVSTSASPAAPMQRWFGRFQMWPKPEGVLCRDFLLPAGKMVPAARYSHLQDQAREQALFQYGLLPAAISAFEGAIPASHNEEMLFWQFPCRTEAAAWDSHADIKEACRTGDTLHLYLGLPWASWIDCERKQAWSVAGLMTQQRQLQVARVRISGWRHALAEVGLSLQVHTVCQHIYWRDLCEVCRLECSTSWLYNSSMDLICSQCRRCATQRRHLYRPCATGQKNTGLVCRRAYRRLFIAIAPVAATARR